MSEVCTYQAVVIKKATTDDRGRVTAPAQILGRVPEFVAHNECQAKALVIAAVHKDEKLSVVFENILDYEVRLEAQTGYTRVF